MGNDLPRATEVAREVIGKPLQDISIGKGAGFSFSS